MIGNFTHRTSHQGLMTQSALMSPGAPVYVSNRRLQNMNCIYEPSQNLGGLFLGDIISTLKGDLLHRHQIKAILTCMSEKISLSVMMPAHKVLPIQDTLQYPIYHFFDEAAEWIHQKRREGTNVLVHCHAGVSRSATIVVAYLIRFQGWTAHEALSFVRVKRERAKPNANFWNQLLQYENQLSSSKKSPSSIIQNERKKQIDLNRISSKQNLASRGRQSQSLPAEQKYQIHVFTPKRLTQQSHNQNTEHKQEPKTHPRRKKIFDQEHYLSSQVQKHQVMSTETLFAQLPHNHEHRKYSESIIFPDQRNYLPSNPITEDPFRQTKSAIQYRLPHRSWQNYSSEQPRAPSSPFQVQQFMYTQPFELGGYAMHR